MRDCWGSDTRKGRSSPRPAPLISISPTPAGWHGISRRLFHGSAQRGRSTGQRTRWDWRRGVLAPGYSWGRSNRESPVPRMTPSRLHFTQVMRHRTAPWSRQSATERISWGGHREPHIAAHVGAVRLRGYLEVSTFSLFPMTTVLETPRLLLRELVS